MVCTSAGIAGLSGASLIMPSFMPPQMASGFQVPSSTAFTVRV